jgi:hypothetical protein
MAGVAVDSMAAVVDFTVAEAFTAAVAAGVSTEGEAAITVAGIPTAAVVIVAAPRIHLAMAATVFMEMVVLMAIARMGITHTEGITQAISAA